MDFALVNFLRKIIRNQPQPGVWNREAILKRRGLGTPLAGFCKAGEPGFPASIGSPLLLAKGSSDPPCQLHVLGSDGYALGVNRTEVCVLKESDNVTLSRLLKRKHGVGLPAIRSAEEERLHFAHQPRKRKSSNQ